MEELFDDLIKKIATIKAGLEGELKDAGNKIQKTSFEKRKAILIRQRTAKSKEEAKRFDLSTDEGVINTEDLTVREKRIEKWLTL
jgi:hypothetical protein